MITRAGRLSKDFRSSLLETRKPPSGELKAHDGLCGRAFALRPFISQDEHRIAVAVEPVALALGGFVCGEDPLTPRKGAQGFRGVSPSTRSTSFSRASVLIAGVNPLLLKIM
jgi:hypothetical protein